MAYQLEEINRAASSDPVAFMEESDGRYQDKVKAAADLICEHLSRSPVVLLAGPSGSGKTTTARKIRYELEQRGIGSHTISMDDYFVRQNPDTAPRTPTGEIDYESPNMMDLDLLHQHFTRLTRGEEIHIPSFDFTRQMRDPDKGRTLKLGQDEVAIFEGIHALNTQLTAPHPDATRLYISARSNFMDGDRVCFKGTWLRLTRRAVRDYNFRGTDIEGTMEMWPNVRRGEKLYISPYKNTAHMIFDSALPYEVNVMASCARPLMAAVPDAPHHYYKLSELVAALDRFTPIPPELVPKFSLLHEFIG